MEVGLGPGHIVLDWYPAPPPQKKGTPPIFSPCLLWPNGWVEEDATGTEVDPGPGHIVLDGDPAPPHERGTAVPSFRSMSIVATVAHLSYC